VAGAQVATRRGRRLQALQAVRRAAELSGPGDPDAHRLAVRFCLAESRPANGAAQARLRPRRHLPGSGLSGEPMRNSAAPAWVLQACLGLAAAKQAGARRRRRLAAAGPAEQATQSRHADHLRVLVPGGCAPARRPRRRCGQSRRLARPPSWAAAASPTSTRRTGRGTAAAACARARRPRRRPRCSRRASGRPRRRCCSTAAGPSVRTRVDSPQRALACKLCGAPAPGTLAGGASGKHRPYPYPPIVEQAAPSSALHEQSLPRRRRHPGGGAAPRRLRGGARAAARAARGAGGRGRVACALRPRVPLVAVL